MLWNSLQNHEFLLVLAVVVGPLLLLSLAIPYGILKLRDARSENNDPQIGLKAALNFGFSLALLLALLGLTILVDVNMEDPLYASSPSSTSPYGSSSSSKNSMSTLSNFSPGTRFGLALLVAGVTAAGIQLIFILAVTNQDRYPEARRIFVGWRLAVHSVIVLAAYTVLVVQLFTLDAAPKMSVIQDPLAFLIVWLPSWVIHFMMLRMYQNVSPRRVRLEMPDRPYGG